MSTIPTASKFKIPTKEKSTDNSKDQIIADISKLIGMDEIKQRLNNLIALGELIALRRERDIPTE